MSEVGTYASCRLNIMRLLPRSFPFSPQDRHLWHFVFSTFLNSVPKFLLLFATIIGASFSFRFPEMLGALFTIFSFALAAYIAFARSDIVADRLRLILDGVNAIVERPVDQRLSSPEALNMDVRALRMAQAPHGEPDAETPCDILRGLRIDLRALAAATRETYEADTGSMADSRAPATPVLLEILAEIRRLKKGGLKIQRGLPPFSLFNSFERALAEDLARERVQATPSPFHELD